MKVFMPRCFLRFFFSLIIWYVIVFEKFKYLIYSYFIVICLHWKILCLLGHGSFHLVPFSLLFLGALFYWWLIGFHHSKAKLKFLKTTFQWCIIQFECCIVTHYQWQSTFFFLMVFSNSLLFISMLKLILINIHFMDMKRCMLICFLIAMLVDKEKEWLI